MKRRKFIQAGIGATVGIPGILSPGKHKRQSPPHEKKSDIPDTAVKILGTAQDGGLPQIGCTCRNCRKARKDPNFSRLIVSLAVWDRTEKKCFLIDTSPDIRPQLDLLSFPPPPDGILLTHAHIGHYTGLIFFGYEAMSTSRIPVYCSSRMADFLQTNGPWSQLVEKKNIVLHRISPKSPLDLTQNLTFTPFLVPHRDEYSDTLGFHIQGKNKTLLYIPDIQKWSAWDRSILNEVSKVDYALLDGTFFNQEELPGRSLSKIGHPFISESIHLLSRLARSERHKIYFTHFNHSNPVLMARGEAARIVKEAGFFLAEDGLELAL